MTALQIQQEIYELVTKIPDFEQMMIQPLYKYAFYLWGRVLASIESNNFEDVKFEIDWIIKRDFFQEYINKHSLLGNDSRMTLIDISYHNVRKDRGLFYILEKSGLAKSLINESDVVDSMSSPPQTTRAALRGKFIKIAQEKKRDYTVDWLNLKINDKHQRSVICKDPFKAVDERVYELIENL